MTLGHEMLRVHHRLLANIDRNVTFENSIVQDNSVQITKYQSAIRTILLLQSRSLV